MVVSLHSIFRGLLALALLILCSADLLAQRSPFDSVWTKEAEQIREEVDCFTDRSLYICDELIHFSARVSLNGTVGPRAWSTVLYVELVSEDGRQMARGKYPILDQVSSGQIRIPSDLLTGHYYLRTYTRWMRNRGPGHFSYLPLRIINPRRSELYQSSPSGTNSAPVPVDGIKEIGLEFTEHPSSFERGDSVVLNLLVAGGHPLEGAEGCLMVVPLGAAPSFTRYSYQNSVDNFRLDFLPDRDGPSLSGSVNYLDTTFDELPPALIHLSLVGDATGYLVCRSDPRGRFTVGLPMRSGKLEIFVQPEGPDKRAVEVRIDQDFDPRFIHFVSSPFTLTEQEVKLVSIMARNVQLTRIFGHGDTVIVEGPGERKSSFYGTPSFSVDLDQYVLLPTLQEVFRNFVPGVTAVGRRGRTSLLIESENPSLSLYESLVMVDQVPVLDMEQFMSLSPAKIKQIDVVEDVYVKGDMRFGGVINLLSRDKDMAGIDLPENSFFIDYLAMQPAYISLKDSSSPEDQIPDMRNTFLWEPDYKLGMDSPARLSFIAPAYPGRYVILFQGHDQGGKPVLAETTFEVR